MTDRISKPSKIAEEAFSSRGEDQPKAGSGRCVKDGRRERNNLLNSLLKLCDLSCFLTEIFDFSEGRIRAALLANELFEIGENYRKTALFAHDGLTLPQAFRIEPQSVA